MKIEKEDAMNVIKEFWAKSDGVLGYNYRNNLLAEVNAIGKEKPSDALEKKGDGGQE